MFFHFGWHMEELIILSVIYSCLWPHWSAFPHLWSLWHNNKKWECCGHQNKKAQPSKKVRYFYLKYWCLLLTLVVILGLCFGIPRLLQTQYCSVQYCVKKCTFEIVQSKRKTIWTPFILGSIIIFMQWLKQTYTVSH